jgi:hypothetical protein
MRHLVVSAVVVCALVVASPAQYRLPTPLPTGPKVIKAGRILNVAAGTYLRNQGILTAGDKIKEVGPWEQVRGHAGKTWL